MLCLVVFIYLELCAYVYVRVRVCVCDKKIKEIEAVDLRENKHGSWGRLEGENGRGKTMMIF